MNPHVILNPKAGSVDDLDALRRQIETLNPERIYVTPRKGAAQAQAAAALRRGAKYLIAAGGDGTLNEVVNAIGARPNIKLGLLPLGTGNDFARSMNLPLDVPENLKLLKKCRTRPIDLVRVRSDKTRYFVNVSAGGFSGAVNEKLTPAIKKTWGPLAYARSAAAALPKLRAYRTTLRFERGDSIALDVYNVVVANGRYVAGGLLVAPKARPFDGLLDVIVIPKLPVAELALLTARLVVGKHLTSDAIIFRRVKKVFVKSRPGMWFNVDGELVGNEPSSFEIIPRALQFVVERK